jgi:phosphonate transport system substrate-binding protein
VRAAAPAPAPPTRAEQRRPGELVIGLVPEVNVFKQKARFEPLAEWLSKSAGVPVRFTSLPHYGSVLDGLEAGRLDGALLGSFAAAVAIERMGAVPVARPVGLDGASTYRGVLFVRRDSGLTTAAQLRGKRMVFVDRATTAGWVFPLAWLRERGVPSPEGFFSESWFAGSHDAAIAAVLDRKADVGAAKSNVLDEARAADPRVDRELLVLGSSPPYPSNAFVLRGDVDPAVAARLREALLGLEKAPGGPEVLARLRALRFVETAPADYRPVHELAARAGVRLEHPPADRR